MDMTALNGLHISDATLVDSVRCRSVFLETAVAFTGTNGYLGAADVVIKNFCTSDKQKEVISRRVKKPTLTASLWLALGNKRGESIAS